MMAHALAHPYSLMDTLFESCRLHYRCREWQTAQAHAEAALVLATELGFARHAALVAFFRGMVLAVQGQSVEGLAQMREGLAAYRATGSAVGMALFLPRLAEAYGHVGLKIEKPGDVEGALREAFAQKERLVFLDFITDQTENVFPMVPGGKGLTEMILAEEL